YGVSYNIRETRELLERIVVTYDVYFNENSLYDSGEVVRIIEEFKSRGLAYDKDGAVWLNLTSLGEKEDRVIVKSTGEPTYRLPDICYHKNKLERGFDLVVDLFG